MWVSVRYFTLRSSVWTGQRLSALFNTGSTITAAPSRTVLTTARAIARWPTVHRPYFDNLSIIISQASSAKACTGNTCRPRRRLKSRWATTSKRHRLAEFNSGRHGSSQPNAVVATCLPAVDNNSPCQTRVGLWGGMITRRWSVMLTAWYVTIRYDR